MTKDGFNNIFNYKILSKMSKFKTNQFLVTIEDATLIEILFDGHVTFKDGTEHTKVSALIEANGQENEGDFVAVTFFDKVADIVAEMQDGDHLDISAKISSRPIDSANGTFYATDLMGYFARRSEGKKPERQQSRRRQEPEQPVRSNREGRQQRQNDKQEPSMDNHRRRERPENR